MTHYSVQPRLQIFVKGYRFLSFAKNIGKNIGKKISKNLSSKYSQKLLDHVKTIKTASKKAIQKTAEVTGDLIGNKIANKTTEASNITTKYFRDIRKWNRNTLRKIYISRRKAANYWWIKINIIY